MVTLTRTDKQFERQSFAVIVREFGLGGLGGLARFIRLHHSGPGDCTRDRAQWLTNYGRTPARMFEVTSVSFILSKINPTAVANFQLCAGHTPERSLLHS
jgi:hypothetical protein